MRDEAWILMGVIGLAVLLVIPRRIACRCVQLGLTVFFASGAIVALIMTAIGQVSSISGGLLAAVGAAALALVSFNLFGWAARRA